MSKRELERLAVVVDADAPRAKRRREITTEEKPDVQNAETTRATVSSEERAKAKEEGLRLWQVVKDAVDKECVTVPIQAPVTLPFRACAQTCTHTHTFTVQRPTPFDRVPSSSLETTICTLLHCHQETYFTGRGQDQAHRRRICVAGRGQA